MVLVRTLYHDDTQRNDEGCIQHKHHLYFHIECSGTAAINYRYYA
jgi:hypothetical protein